MWKKVAFEKNYNTKYSPAELLQLFVLHFHGKFYEGIVRSK